MRPFWRCLLLLIFSLALSVPVRTHFQVVASIWLLVIAVWIVLPGRNIYGNPWMEELVDSCTTSDGTKVRLYVGSGFLTAFWYSVTTEAGLFSLERQILQSTAALNCTSLPVPTGNSASRRKQARLSSRSPNCLRSGRTHAITRVRSLVHGA